MDGSRRGKPGIEGKRARFSFWYLLAAFWAVLLLQQGLSSYLRPERIAYSDFKTDVAAGKVAEVAVASDMIRGHLNPPTGAKPTPPTGAKPAPTAEAAGQLFETVRVEDPTLLADLEHHHVKVSGIVESTFWQGALSWLIPICLFGGFWIFMVRRMGQVGQGGFMTVGKNKAKVYMEKDVDVRFTDVAGVDEAKDELREVIEFLKTPQKFSRLGARIPKGVLLVGPPGTGKTLLSRAVAGEAGVPFFSISGSEFVEMFVGVGAARVRDLFEQAQAKAPCIIFIDELDALGKARGVGPMAHEEREQTLNQLLVELDGFDARVGVISMAATNRPEILDPALLRAGRFDRQVLVDRPDKVDRLAILRVHAKKVTLADDADLEGIAGMTAGFVGADLANIINEAALLAVRRDKDTVGKPELQEAVERVVAGLEKRSRVLTRSEKERVAHHEVGHALMALALPGVDAVQKVSIIPRGIAALGYTLQVPTEDRFLMTQGELEDKIAVLMGGRIAEELIFGDASTGAHDDLAKATEIARSMVRQYGMSDLIGDVSLDHERRTPFLPGLEGTSRAPYSEETARQVDAEIRRILDEQRARVVEALGERVAVLREAAELLLLHETVSGDELRALVARHTVSAHDGNGSAHADA